MLYIWLSLTNIEQIFAILLDMIEHRFKMFTTLSHDETEKPDSTLFIDQMSYLLEDLSFFAASFSQFVLIFDLSTVFCKSFSDSVCCREFNFTFIAFWCFKVSTCCFDA